MAELDLKPGPGPFPQDDAELQVWKQNLCFTRSRIYSRRLVSGGVDIGEVGLVSGTLIWLVC